MQCTCVCEKYSKSSAKDDLMKHAILVITSVVRRLAGGQVQAWHAGKAQASAGGQRQNKYLPVEAVLLCCKSMLLFMQR